MITVTIGDQEFWDPEKEEFVTGIKGRTISLEHSLISMSKWEAKHKKIFLEENATMTTDEFYDYIRCMTITPNVDPELYKFISREDLKRITNYIGSSETATTINDVKKTHGNRYGRPSCEKVSTELIYYWMIDCGIPFECQKWHISRLLTLIRVCNIKANASGGGGKKMSKQDILRQNAALNAQRRAARRTRG